MKKFTAQEFYNMAYARGLDLDWILEYDYVNYTFNEWCLTTISDCSELLNDLATIDITVDELKEYVTINTNIIRHIVQWMNEE